MNWSAKRYSAFENERTRPVRDLVAALPNERVARAVDLGCGGQLHRGAGRALSGRRDQRHGQFAGHDRRGAQAPARLSFELSDIAAWNPPGGYDVILANASLQWVPGHEELYPRLVGKLAPGGSLAVQTPDNMEEPAHRLAREVAADGPGPPGSARSSTRRATAPPGTTNCSSRSAAGWTCAHHLSPSLAGAAAVVQWFTSTALRPYLGPLDPAEQQAFLAEYQSRIERAYPALSDGTVLLPFPRLFIVAGAK